MKKTFLITQLFICLSFYGLCQPATGIDQNESSYQEALNHYEAGHYNLARASFEKYIGNNKGANLGDAHYYRAVSAIRLFHNDGEFLLESFIKDFPLHSKSATARFTIGEYYFSNGNYSKAISSFEKTKPSAGIACDLYFKLGYSYLSKRQFDDAKANFAKVTNQSCRHYLASNYYLGYLYYQDDELDKALKVLTNAAEDESFGKSAALMTGNIYFRNENYREAIGFVRGLAPETLDKNPDLYFIRGGAHYELKEYEEAIRSYTSGLERTRNRATSDVFFNLAESYRLTEQSQKAIDYYKLSALDDSETGAYSSYYLGKLYVETENPTYARSAFSEALKTENETIREEALYQLAKVEYDLGNYTESIRQLQKYNEDYSSGKYRTEVSEYITRSFLNTSDYDVAINYIESLNSLSQNLRSTYQEVTFLKGADLFNNRKFSASVKYFDKSLKYKESADRAVAAHFWKAEAYSIAKLYEEAISSYKSALYTTPSGQEGRQLHIRARYGLGYAYYNSKSYPDALANFKSYLLKIPENANERVFYRTDARLRLADCYYVTKAYQNAIETYESLLDQGNSNKDYIYFQLGIVSTLLGENNKAQTYFRNVIDGYPSSDYVDNAVLQMAETSFEAGNYKPAIEGFTELINNYTQSPLVPYALVKRALAYSNLGEYQKSEADYKEVLDQYITHKTANSALLGLQELSAKRNVSDFDQYLEKYQLANPDDESLETVEFEAAKTLYFNQLYEKAIAGFKKFQTNYPASGLVSEANYYIADSYFRSGREDESVEYLKLVVEDDLNSYQTRSLDRLGDILVRQENYSEALKYYQKLEQRSRNRRELGNAWEGVMSINFLQGNLAEAVNYAEKILAENRLSSDLKNKATLTLGKIRVAEKNYNEAEDLFLTLVNGIKDENAAEANYELAQLYLETDQYKNALQTLFGLNKNFAQYDRWIGKSFLLIADIYMEQGELFQAKATLNSIIENAEAEDLKNQAREKLEKLSKLEKEVVIEEESTVTPNDTLSNPDKSND